MSDTFTSPEGFPEKVLENIVNIWISMFIPKGSVEMSHAFHVSCGLEYQNESN